MIENLKKLGFTVYEAKAYLALLEQGPSTASVISRKSKVPQGKIYETLNKLIDKGIVIEKLLDPKKYEALKPEEAFHKWTEDKKNEFEQLSKEALEQLKNLKKEKPEQSILDTISFIQGRKQNFDIATLAVKRCKKEILIISVGEQIPYPLFRELSSASKRKVKIKMIVTKHTQENKEILIEFIKHGFEIRHSKTQGYSIAVIDGQEIILSVRKPEYPNSGELVGFHIQNKELSDAFVKYFRGVWRKAEPIT